MVNTLLMVTSIGKAASHGHIFTQRRWRGEGMNIN